MKKMAPKSTCVPARKNGGYFSIKYFVVIMLVTVNISAQNSREFPRTGFGASSLISEPKLNTTEPIIPKKIPRYAILGICSFKINVANMTINIGSNELTTPACPELVNLRACVSNKK